MLSVVIPAYYEEETVPAAAQRIGAVLTQAQIPHELIFVDDGSKDALRIVPESESRNPGRCRG